MDLAAQLDQQHVQFDTVLQEAMELAAEKAMVMLRFVESSVFDVT